MAIKIIYHPNWYEVVTTWFGDTLESIKCETLAQAVRVEQRLHRLFCEVALTDAGANQ